MHIKMRPSNKPTVIGTPIIIGNVDENGILDDFGVFSIWLVDEFDDGGGDESIGVEEGYGKLFSSGEFVDSGGGDDGGDNDGGGGGGGNGVGLVTVVLFWLFSLLFNEGFHVGDADDLVDDDGGDFDIDVIGDVRDDDDVDVDGGDNDEEGGVGGGKASIDGVEEDEVLEDEGGEGEFDFARGGDGTKGGFGGGEVGTDGGAAELSPADWGGDETRGEDGEPFGEEAIWGISHKGSLEKPLLLSS